MKLFKTYAPQLIFVLVCSTLCVSYFIEEVVLYQLIIDLLLLLLYFIGDKNNLNTQISGSYKLFVLFAFIYLVRAFVDLVLLGERQNLYNSDFTVYYYLITGMLLPAIFIPKLKIQKSFDYAFLIISALIFVSLSISLSNILSGNFVLTNDQRIQGNENLGVIQYAHLGLTGAIFGFVFFLKRNENKIYKYLSIPLALVGVGSMFFAGTRGAIISLFLILAVYLIANARLRTFVIFLILFFVFDSFIDQILDFFDSLGATSATRIFRFFSEGGDQSSGRSEIWLKALSDIASSPILGVSCFYHSPDVEVTYVHNSFIEVTYALGIFGLYVFARLNWIAIKASILSIKNKRIEHMAFSFLYLQYFTYTLFSESVIRLPLFWIFLLMMLNIRNTQLKNE